MQPTGLRYVTSRDAAGSDFLLVLNEAERSPIVWRCECIKPVFLSVVRVCTEIQDSMLISRRSVSFNIIWKLLLGYKAIEGPNSGSQTVF